jgi:uncharacterized membrane protein YfcA
MSPIMPYLVTCLVLFVSTLARSAFGFGDALIAMPLLTLAIGLRTAAPLVALVGTTIAFIILWRNWRVVDLRASGRLIVASLLGIPVGLLFLKDVPEPLMQACLGVLLIAFSIYSLVQPGLVIRRDRGAYAGAFGFGAGVLGGAYNTVGPLIVVYGQLRRWAPERFRATLQSCFLPTYFAIVVGHGFAGLLTVQVFRMYSLALPLVLVAIFLGGRLNACLERERFTRWVNTALIGIGLVLCLRSWFL